MRMLFRGIIVSAQLRIKEKGMPDVNWFYFRSGWVTCKRAQEYLATNQISISVQTNAAKERFGLGNAKKLLESADHLYSSRGRKYVHIDLVEKDLTSEEVSKWMLGPTGNLRAPTVVYGRIVYVGFNEEAYQGILTD